MLEVSKLKEEIRSGEFAWPGGYQRAAIISDGGVMCFDCLKTEFKSIIRSMMDHTKGYPLDGWEVEGITVLWEGPDDYCCHCNKVIATEYGDSKENN